MIDLVDTADSLRGSGTLFRASSQCFRVSSLTWNAFYRSVFKLSYEQAENLAQYSMRPSSRFLQDSSAYRISTEIQRNQVGAHIILVSCDRILEEAPNK
jgi:hypothetical protein